MIYLLFLFYIYIYFRANIRSNINSYNLLILSSPIIIIWVLMIGGQYGVGTDYFSYIYYFTTPDTSYFDERGDLLFGFFIRLSHSFGFYGQDLMFILSFLWIILLLFIGKTFLLDSNFKYLCLFFFVYITFSTSFNNQMNGQRQYTCVYYFTLAFLLLLKNCYLYSVPLYLCAAFTHFSSITIIPLSVLLYFSLFKYKSFDVEPSIRSLYVCVIGSVILSNLINNVSYITPFIDYLRNAGMFEDYTAYYNRDIEIGGGLDRITKYIYAPLLIYSIHKLRYMNISLIERRFFIIGIFAYSFKILLTGIPYVARLGAYFEILMCVPIVQLLMHLKKKKLNSQFILCFLYLLLPFALKVTFFAVKEYTYNSIFFK